MSILNKIIKSLNFNSESILDIDDVKDFFLSTLLKFIAISGLIATIPNLLSDSITNTLETTLFYIIVTVIIFWFTFFSKTTYSVKAIFMSVAFLVVGTSTVIIIGPIYIGPFWLFAAILVISALYSLRLSFISIIYSNLVIYFFTVAFPLYNTYWGRQKEISDSEALSIFISFLAVSTAFGFLVNRAFRYLEKITVRYNQQKTELLSEKEASEKTAGTLKEEISERKIIEDQLVKSERRLMQALEASKDGYWEWNVESGEVYFSPRYYTMLGYKANEFQPSFKAFDSLIFPGDKEDFLKVLNNSLHTGIDFEYELRLKSKNENWIWILTKGKVVEKKADGKALRFMGVHSDINDKKQAELKLNNLNASLQEQIKERTKELEYTLETLRQENNTRKEVQRELTQAKDDLTKALSNEKELNELKSRFISMITHEYRTPLTAILTSTYVIDILFEKHDKEEFDKYLKKIQTSVESMNNLLEDVLMLGEYQFNNKYVDKSKINLVELVEKTVEDQIKYYGKIRKFSIQNQHNLIYIETNIRIFRYIFSNIISNALKYSGDDSTFYISIDINEKSVVLKVRDEGIGIMEEDLEKLYDPFHRGKNVGAISGTGLGLALVKQYSEILDINVDIKSKINEGTEVTLELLNALKS